MRLRQPFVTGKPARHKQGVMTLASEEFMAAKGAPETLQVHVEAKNDKKLQGLERKAESLKVSCRNWATSVPSCENWTTDPGSNHSTSPSRRVFGGLPFALILT